MLEVTQWAYHERVAGNAILRKRGGWEMATGWID